MEGRGNGTLISGVPPEFSEAQGGVFPYLQLIWNQRRPLAKAGSIAFAASLLLALLIPVRYQSVTRLMPPDNQGSGLAMLAAMAGHGGLDSMAGDLLGIKNSGALFIGILHSESAEDALIRKFNLQKVYGRPKIEDARKALESQTEISEDRKSGIIFVAVTDHDPRRAAAIAQTYVVELDRLVAQVSTSSARREREFLEQRLQAVKLELDTAAKKFSDFASKNTAIDIPAQGKAMVEAAATLQGQLIAAQAEVSGLQQIYAAQNFRVRSAEARVRELQKKLDEIGGDDTSNTGKDDNSIYPSIRKLPVLGVTYSDLYRQTKIEETVYELLTQQYELAKVQEAKEIPTVKVLDVAQIPTKKTFPPRTMIVILGSILGVCIGLVWIVAKQQWEAVDATDVRKTLAREVVATVHAAVSRSWRNGRAAGPDSNLQEGTGNYLSRESQGR